MFVVALAYLAFFTIALPPSMLGVAWPSIQLSFGVPLSAAGLVAPVGVAAGLISTSMAAGLTGRFGVGRVLAAGTLLSAVGLAGNGLSATWWQFWQLSPCSGSPGELSTPVSTPTPRAGSGRAGSRCSTPATAWARHCPR